MMSDEEIAELTRFEQKLEAIERYEEAREAAEARQRQEHDPREAHRRLDESARRHWESRLSSERTDPR